jgi:predicted NUDIX family phosphoesterase
MEAKIHDTGEDMDKLEFVYVVKRSNIKKFCCDGFTYFDLEKFQFAEFNEIVIKRGFFIERSHAENDPYFKQIIPYAVLIRDDCVFQYQRKDKGGEARLYGKKSIGVGGHINPVDISACGDYLGKLAGRELLCMSAAMRELREELVIPKSFKSQIIGIINDDSNKVGSVHIGLVVSVRLADGGHADVRETDYMEGCFTKWDEIDEHELESWSRALIAHMQCQHGG